MRVESTQQCWRRWLALLRTRPLKLREDFEPENTIPNTALIIIFSQLLLHQHRERFSVSWRKNVH